MSDASHNLSGTHAGATSVTSRVHGDVLTCDEWWCAYTWIPILQMGLTAKQGPIEGMSIDMAMNDGRDVSDAVLDIKYRMRPG